jgi:cysteine desulfurase/selenocysteine lyase
MSTSEQSLAAPALPEANSGGALLPGSSALPGSAGIAPGVLSPAELARMANAMFNALPDEMQQPANTAARCGVAGELCIQRKPLRGCAQPHRACSSWNSRRVCRAAAWSGFVATPDHSVPPDARSSASVPAAPVSSQAGAAPRAPPDPAFAFLADARPLFVPPAAEPAPQNTPAFAFGSAVPSEEGFASIPSSLFTDVPASQSAGTPQPPAPAVPGAFGVVDSSAIPAFSFLEDARPLFSNPATLPGPYRPMPLRAWQSIRDSA